MLLMLAVVAIAHGIAQSVRAMARRASSRPGDQAQSPPAAAPIARPVWWYAIYGLALLILAAAVITATDMLAAKANSRVIRFDKNWWGSVEEYPWAKAAAHGLTFQSRDLTIKIDGDQLNATYTLTAPANSVLARTAESDMDSGSGEELVDDVLGQVQVGEF